MSRLLRTTLPRITRSAPLPPVNSRGARSCREPVSLPISTTEETHKTQDIRLGLWHLSLLCLMRGCTGSLYRDVRPLRGKAGICPHNLNYGYLTLPLGRIPRPTHASLKLEKPSGKNVEKECMVIQIALHFVASLKTSCEKL
jgi:hypothetical protein